MTPGDGKRTELDRALGFEAIRELGAERAMVDYRVGPHMCHSGGIAQGGFVCGWIDAVMARLLTAIHGPGVLTLSLEIKVSYLAPARLGIVTAEAWPVGGGRSLAFVEGQLVGQDLTLLARASSTFKLVRRQAANATG